jgi:hypothetical protein
MIVALLALFVALAGTAAATTQTFTLGTTNRVDAPSTVVNVKSTGTTSPVDAPLLTLDNRSSTANSTPLSLLAAPNHAPFKVNTQTKVANLNADQLDGMNGSAFVRARKLTWVAMPLSNFGDVFFSNYGSGWSTAAYAKDPFGVVHLKGLVKCQANELLFCNPPATIAVLPAGYRPPEHMVFAATSDDKFGRITVASDGRVESTVGNTVAWVSLDGITFPAT